MDDFVCANKHKIEQESTSFQCVELFSKIFSKIEFYFYFNFIDFQLLITGSKNE